MNKFLHFKVFFLLVLQVLAAQDLLIQYKCGETTEISNRICPYLQIKNNSMWDSYALSQLSIRYYYTVSNTAAQQCSIDYAVVGSSNITSTFIKEDTKNMILELRFKTSAGVINPGTDTGVIQARINNSDWSNYDQRDDYSFDKTFTNFANCNKICLYKNDVLIWGTTRDGLTPDVYPRIIPVPLPGDDWLHTSGNKIVDKDGRFVRITGINWFGFETPTQGLDGLWATNLEKGLNQIAESGFNLIRLPICVQLITEWRKGNSPLAGSINLGLNPNLANISSLDLLDKIVAYCSKIGVKIMLDMHRVVNTAKHNTWYYDIYTVDDYYASWEWLARRYKDNDTIIAMDIFNEPHGLNYQEGNAAAKWDGSLDKNNFKSTAEEVARRILAINPNLLIMVEGIHSYPRAGYDYTSLDQYSYYYNWWGGNLRGVAKYPVNLGQYQNKLVYEPHDYGPTVYLQDWFYSGFTAESLFNDCWQPNWFYIHQQNIAPLLIGEWGSKMVSADDIKWFLAFANFIKQNQLNYTYWCFNPNSGDTGGIMMDDWNTVDLNKYAIVKDTLWKNSQGVAIGLDHAIPLGKSGTNISAYYSGN